MAEAGRRQPQGPRLPRRRRLALKNLGDVALKLGRAAEALDAYGRADHSPRTAGQGESDEDVVPHLTWPDRCVGRGLARRALGDPAGAAADVRQALRLL